MLKSHHQLGQSITRVTFRIEEADKHILLTVEAAWEGRGKSELNKHLLLGSSYNQKGINP